MQGLKSITLKCLHVTLQISDVIKDHSAFAKDLDWSARPGTKTYPRWKDALIGCFKVRRSGHLKLTFQKSRSKAYGTFAERSLLCKH